MPDKSILLFNKFLAIILVLLIIGCTPKPDSKILKVGVSGQMPPYSYYEEENNKLVGFDIDIATELAKRMDRKLDIQVYSFNRLIAAVLSKQIDIGMGSMNIVPERQEVVDFTNPYNVSTGLFWINEELKHINSIDDIKNSHIQVGIRNGTVYPKILVDEYGFSYDQLKIFPSQRDLIIALKNKTVKIAISDYGAIHHLNKHSDINLKYLKKKITNAEAGMTVHKKNTELLSLVNEKLEEMHNDGSYDRIARKWFGRNPLTDPL